MHRRASPKVFAESYEFRHNQTEAEARLWRVLRMHRLENKHFRRQHAIGPFIVDFCAPRQKLVIEGDGIQHQDQLEYDQARTDFLESKGYRVLRFWNQEVFENLERVIGAIHAATLERTLTKRV